MAILNIRNLSGDVHKALRLRAAEHGRSMEAEAREILAEACRPRLSGEEIVRRLKEAGRTLFGDTPPEGLLDDLFAMRREEARRFEQEADRHRASEKTEQSRP